SPRRHQWRAFPAAQRRPSTALFDRCCRTLPHTPYPITARRATQVRKRGRCRSAHNRGLVRHGGCMHGTGVLDIALLFLAAAVIAVPLFRHLGLGAVLGYLAAGIAIGPHVLALVPDP